MHNILGPEVKEAYAAWRANRDLQEDLHKKGEEIQKKFGVMEGFGWAALVSLVITSPLHVAMSLNGWWLFPAIFAGALIGAVICTWIFHPNAVLWKKRQLGKNALRVNAAQKQEKDVLKNYQGKILEALAIRDELKVKDQFKYAGFANYMHVTTPEGVKYDLEIIEGTPCFLSSEGELLTRNYADDTKTTVRSDKNPERIIALDKDALNIIRNT